MRPSNGCSGDGLSMAELVPYLLAHRHRLPNRTIIHCLGLAQLAPRPDQRLSWRDLAQVLDISHQSYISKALGQLEHYGLVQYEAGTVAEPGYLFFRIGPARGRREARP